MSIEFKVHLTGMKEFKAGIRGLRGNVLTAARNSLPQIGFILEANSRDMCPVDTGSLRSCIGNFDESYLVKELRPNVSPADAVWEMESESVFVGTNVHYAQTVHDRVPWFVSALRASIGDIIDAFRQAAAEGIMKSFGGILHRKAQFIMNLTKGRSRRRGR